MLITKRYQGFETAYKIKIYLAMNEPRPSENINLNSFVVRVL